MAVAILILWPLVAEPIIGAVLGLTGIDDPLKWMPYQSGIGMVVNELDDVDSLRARRRRSLLPRSVVGGRVHRRVLHDATRRLALVMAAKKAAEERDGVELTNLDQPLFDGAGATKRALVDYFDAMADRILSRSSPIGRSRSSGSAPARRRSCRRTSRRATPDWVRDDHRLGGGVEARGALRAVQRPPHAAVVRQPARRRAPPDAWRRSASRSPTHLVLDLDPPEGAAFDVVIRTAHARARRRWTAPACRRR